VGPIPATRTSSRATHLTYFGPLFRGAYPEVSPLAHVHGWSFFGWYLLLHEYRKSHAISPVYLAGASAMTVLIGSAFLLAVTPHGDLVKQGIGAIGRTLEPLY
jgi:hypothetical protein